MNNQNKWAAAYLLVATLAALTSARPGDGAAAPQTLSFHVSAACMCAPCVFDARRVLGKFGGVSKITLSTRDRRLDLVFDESKHPVSALARAFEQLDLGKDSALLWPLPPNVDVKQAASALAHVPGIRAAIPDAKAHVVSLAFAAAKDAPPVTTAQLGDALKGLNHA